jgi:hypothetical protein
MHDIELVVVKKMPFPLTNREFLNRYLSFKELSGDLVLVFEALPDGTKVDYGANLKVERAKSTGTFRFKPLNDDSQCEVTLVHHGHAGGFVPERVMVAKIPQALSAVSNMREHFQRDDAIDDAKRSELAEIIKCVPLAITSLPPPQNLTPPPLLTTHRAAPASSRTCRTRTSSSTKSVPSSRAWAMLLSRSSTPPTTSSTCSRPSRRGAAPQSGGRLR